MMIMNRGDTAWWLQNKDAANMPQSSLISTPEELTQQAEPFKRAQISPHIMPSPSGLRWNMQNMSWGMATPQPPLVQFKGNDLNRDGSASLHCKRKSDLHVNIPNKQFISDEKMAAHLNGLHISSDYTTHTLPQVEHLSSVPSTSQGQSRVLFSNEDLAKRLKSAQKVILCEEIMNFTDDSMLPTSYLRRMNEQRCMSLVLWKPPEKCLSTIMEDDDKNNNEDSTVTSTNCRQSVLSMENIMDIEM